MSRLATTITMLVTSTAKQENSRRSLARKRILSPPLCLPVQRPSWHSEPLPSVCYPTQERSRNISRSMLRRRAAEIIRSPRRRRASMPGGIVRPSALKVRKSIDLDVRSIHDSCPFLCLCSDEGGEVLGRAHLGCRAELGEDRFHLLRSHNRVNLSVEPVDNRCQGSGGCEHG